MTKKSEGKRDQKKQPKYELTVVDLQVLKAVDIIIAENKRKGVEPNQVTEISELIFGNRTAISRMRSSDRGITIEQLMKFATYFNIDTNYFFSARAELFYEIQPTQQSDSGKSHAVITYGNNNTTIHAGEGTINGGVHTGEIRKQIIKAKNYISKLPTEFQEQCNTITDTILQETEDIKKISDAYENQVLQLLEEKKSREKEISDLKDELRQARENELMALRQLTGKPFNKDTQ